MVLVYFRIYIKDDVAFVSIYTVKYIYIYIPQITGGFAFVHPLYQSPRVKIQEKRRRIQLQRHNSVTPISDMPGSASDHRKFRQNLGLHHPKNTKTGLEPK